MEENLVQLGALAVISIFAVKEFFGYLKAKSIEGEHTNVRDDRNTFDRDIARELGGINEKLKVIPEIKNEVTRLADHVKIQNGRIGKSEKRLETLEQIK